MTTQQASQHEAKSTDLKADEDYKEEISTSPTNDADPTAVKEVQNAAFAQIIEQADDIHPWSKSSVKLYSMCLVAFCCATSNGFDGSLMSAINVMPFYQSYFGMETLGATTGFVFAIYTVGNMVGTFFAGPAGDKFGRRGGMFIGSMIIVFGAAIITASQNRHMFLAGRFFLGFGVSISTTSAPSYVVEVAPPKYRGRLAGLYNTTYYVGAILATGITVATGRRESDLSWRLPLSLQIVPAAIVCIFVWFLPESPRWHVANSQDDKALAFLTQYHGAGNPNHPIVLLEMAEFKQSIQINASDKRWWDYSELFNSRSARYRTFLAVLMGFFGQWSGNGLGYFLPSLLAAIGKTTTNQQLLYNFLNYIISWCGALIGAAVTDKMGRRKVLVFGTLACAGCLSIVLGCTGRFQHLKDSGVPLRDSQNVASAALAFIYLFWCTFSFTYTPLQALYVVECLHTTSRIKGKAFETFIVNCAAFVNTYAIPIALKRIGYKMWAVYVGWDVFEALIWYLFAVETRGRTLEELDEIFEARHPARASVAKKETIVKAE